MTGFFQTSASLLDRRAPRFLTDVYTHLEGNVDTTALSLASSLIVRGLSLPLSIDILSKVQTESLPNILDCCVEDDRLEDEMASRERDQRSNPIADQRVVT